MKEFFLHENKVDCAEDDRQITAPFLDEKEKKQEQSRHWNNIIKKTFMSSNLTILLWLSSTATSLLRLKDDVGMTSAVVSQRKRDLVYKE